MLPLKIAPPEIADRVKITFYAPPENHSPENADRKEFTFYAPRENCSP